MQGLKRILGGLLAACLAFSAHAANLTPDQLTAAVTINNTDLLVIYPTGGPMKSVQWSVAKALMQTALGATYLQVANNLSDVASPTTTRSNLGLGSAALANTGTSGAALCLLNTSCNFSAKLITAASASGGAGFNLAPGVAPVLPANGDCWLTSTAFVCRINGVSDQFMVGANNLSEITSASTARTNLNLGTSATVNTGTSGSTLGLLSTANTYSLTQTFTGTNAAAPINLQSVNVTSPNNGDIWIGGGSVLARIAGSTVTLGSSGVGAVTSFNGRTGGVSLLSSDVNTVLAGDTLTGLLTFLTSSTSGASLNIPQGVAPTSPNNGDCWTTSAALFCHLGGVNRQVMVGVDNLSELTNVTAAQSNLGVVAAGADTTYAFRANNLSDLGSASTARTNLGLGTAATQATGTSGATLPFLNGTNTWSGPQTLSVSSTPNLLVLNQTGANDDVVVWQASGTNKWLMGPKTNSTSEFLLFNINTSVGDIDCSFTTDICNFANVPTASGGTALVLTNDSRFSGITQNLQAGAYTLVLTDAGRQVLHQSASNHTYTIPANASVAYPIGTKIEIINAGGGGILTLAITSDSLVWAPSGTTGSRTLAANAITTLTKVTSTSWYIAGVGIT